MGNILKSKPQNKKSLNPKKNDIKITLKIVILHWLRIVKLLLKTPNDIIDIIVYYSLSNYFTKLDKDLSWTDREGHPTPFKNKVKILVIGPPKSGKTTFISQFCRNKFDNDSFVVGIRFRYCAGIFCDTEIVLEFTDLGSSMEYQNYVFRAINLVLLFYDINDLESFNKLKFWLNLINSNKNESTIVGIVANKYDLVKINNNCYNAKEFANENNILYFGEISCVNKNGFDKMINGALSSIEERIVEFKRQKTNL